MRNLFTCLLLLLCPLPAAAQALEAPKSVSDCERIKNDMAYNQCLASFGPKRGERGSRGAADGDDDEPVTQRSSGRGKAGRRGRAGREAAAFNVVSGKRGAARDTAQPTRVAAGKPRGSRKRR